MRASLIFLWLASSYLSQSDLGVFLVTSIGAPSAPRLSNGALLIHPLFLYTYYSVFLCFISVNLLHILNSRASSQKWDLSIFIQPPIASGFVAVILGAWWSNQEFNWGGAWSWDLVEVYLLSTITWSTLFVHTRIRNVMQTYIQLAALLTLVTYFLAIRANIGNSVHSFAPSISASTYVWCFVLFIFFSALSFYQSSYFFKKSTTFNYSLTRSKLLLILIVFCINAPIILNYFYFLITPGGSIDLGIFIPAIFIFVVTPLILPITTSIQLYLPFIDSLYIKSLIRLSKIINPAGGLHFTIFALLVHFLLYYNLTLLVDTYNNSFLSISISRSTGSVVEQLHATEVNSLAINNGYNPRRIYNDTSYYLTKPAKLIESGHTPTLIEYPSCTTHYYADTNVFPFYKFYKIFWVSSVWVYVVLTFLTTWFYRRHKYKNIFY